MDIPSGNLKLAIENGPVETVSFPSTDDDFPYSYGCLPEGMLYQTI